MKKLLAILLTALMIVSLFSACGDKGTQAGNEPSTSSGEPAKTTSDRVLHLCSSETLPTIDPEAQTKLRTNEIMYNVYEGLVYYNYEDGVAEPRVAESFDVSEDGTVYTFHLRSGVKFHNGDPVTVEDVVFSYDRAMASGVRTTHTAAIDSYKALDDKTFELTLKYACSPFIEYCSEIYIYSKAFCDAHNDILTDCACGTGPYMITSCDLNALTVMEAFEDYYRGAASIKRVEWAVITDTTSAAMALQSGDLDFLQVAWSQAAQLEEQGFTIGNIPARHTTYLSFNCSAAPFDNPKMRQAIAYFVDREEIVDVAFDGFADPAKYAQHPDMIGFPSDKSLMEPYAMTFDPDKGIALLKELGYDTTKEIDLGKLMCYPEGHYLYKPAQVIQDQLARYNIKVELESMDGQAFTARYYPGEFTMAVCGHSCGGDASAYSTIWCTTTMGQQAGNAHYDWDYEMDNLFDQSLRATSEEERNSVFLNILQRLHDNCPEIGLAHKHVIAAYKESELNVVLRMDYPLMYEWSWK